MPVALQITEEDLVGIEPARVTSHYTDRFGNIIRTEDPIGNVFLMEYEDPLNPRLVTSRTTPSGTMEYTYNDQGNPRNVTDQKGKITLYEYAEDVDMSVPPAHRNLLRKVHRPQVTVPGDPPSLVQYDPTEFLYDTAGNLTEIVDAKGNSTVLGIRSDGQVSSVTDRRGFTTLFRYNDDLMETDRGLLREIETPGDGTDNPARILSLVYDSVYDDVVQVEDPLGNLWQTEFDALSRTVTATDARDKSTLYTYLDGLLDQVELPANNGSGTDTRMTNYLYDDRGRLTEVHSDIDAMSQQLRAKFEYDSFSNLRKLTRLMNSVEKYTEYDYDILDRVTHMRDPMHTGEDPRETYVSHSPFCAQRNVTTARGMERQYNFDVRCQLTVASSPDEENLYEYDELRRLVSVTQSHDSRYSPRTTSGPDALFSRARYSPSESVRTFEYDELDRLIKMTFEDETTMVYEWDEESNLTKLTVGGTDITRYTYYKDNRLKEVILEREGDDDRIFTYRYDEAGRLKTLEYPGDTGITAYFGYFDEEDNWIHGYNENGQLTYLEYRNSTTSVQKFAYEYDDSGNRMQLTDTAAGTDPIIWDYSYNRLDQLATVTRTVPANPSIPDVVRTYLYDESDNRIQLDFTLGEDPTQTTLYNYNLADEITERWVDETLMETFNHDKDGNMIARLLNPGGAEQESRYRFDEWNRLVRIENGPPNRPAISRQRNRYDSGNIRKSKKTKDGTVTTYRYNSLTVATEATTPAGGAATPTSFFAGHQVLGFERNGNFYYLLSDGLSSVRLVVDEDGDVVASYDADEFGNPTVVSESGVSTDQRWVGGLGYKDEVAATGLYYLRQRYYDAGLGKFLNRDPGGYRSGLNLYSYVYSNPVNVVDPTGLDGFILFYNGQYTRYKYNEMYDMVYMLRQAKKGQIAGIFFNGHGCDWSMDIGGGRQSSGESISWDKTTDKVQISYHDPNQGGKMVYVTLEELGLPEKDIKVILLRGCNTAGGPPNWQELRSQHPTESESHYPEWGDNQLTNAVARHMPGTVVGGEVGLFYDQTLKWAKEYRYDRAQWKSPSNPGPVEYREEHYR